jgi:hypothetical protein
MEISRRQVLRWGQVCLAAAAVPGRIRGAAGDSSDKLLTLSRADFVPLIGSRFQTTGPAGQPVWLLLLSAEQAAFPAAAPDGRGIAPRVDTFLLTFSRNGEILPQGTYTMQHDTLGTLPLFIVPSGELTSMATVSHLKDSVPPDSIPRRRTRTTRAKAQIHPASPRGIPAAETAAARG